MNPGDLVRPMAYLAHIYENPLGQTRHIGYITEKSVAIILEKQIDTTEGYRYVKVLTSDGIIGWITIPSLRIIP